MNVEYQEQLNDVCALRRTTLSITLSKLLRRLVGRYFLIDLQKISIFSLFAECINNTSAL